MTARPHRGQAEEVGVTELCVAHLEVAQRRERRGQRQQRVAARDGAADAQAPQARQRRQPLMHPRPR